MDKGATNCTQVATALLFQIVGIEGAVAALPMGAFCATHLMSEKALHEKRGERMGMQVIGTGPDAGARSPQPCCWLPEDVPEVALNQMLDDLATRRLDSDANGLFSSPERIESMIAMEDVWGKRMPGTDDLRTLLCMVAGMIVKRGVHPRVLADYMREVFRETFPSVFDSPI